MGPCWRVAGRSIVMSSTQAEMSAQTVDVARLTASRTPRTGSSRMRSVLTPPGTAVVNPISTRQSGQPGGVALRAPGLGAACGEVVSDVYSGRLMATWLSMLPAVPDDTADGPPGVNAATR